MLYQISRDFWYNTTQNRSKTVQKHSDVPRICNFLVHHFFYTHTQASSEAATGSGILRSEIRKDEKVAGRSEAKTVCPRGLSVKPTGGSTDLIRGRDRVGYFAKRNTERPPTGDHNVCPSMNSRRMEVGGTAAISEGDIATIYPRNLSRRLAST